MEDETKRILLVGRAGSGKSTVATMLYKRCINEVNDFNISDSVEGATIDTTIKYSKDKKWKIYDTAGLGEPIEGAVPDKEARHKLIELLKKTNEGFHYICIVKSKERFDNMDSQILGFVLTLFDKKDICTNLFFLISSGKQNDTWILDHEAYLRKFLNVDKAITLDFPGYSSEDDVTTVEERRTSSLLKLEHLLLQENANIRPVYPRTKGFTSDKQFGNFADKLLNILKGIGGAINAVWGMIEIINFVAAAFN